MQQHKLMKIAFQAFGKDYISVHYGIANSDLEWSEVVDHSEVTLISRLVNELWEFIYHQTRIAAMNQINIIS